MDKTPKSAGIEKKLPSSISAGDNSPNLSEMEGPCTKCGVDTDGSQNIAVKKTSYSPKWHGRKESSESSEWNGEKEHAKNVFSIKSFQPMNSDDKRNQRDTLNRWDKTDVSMSKPKQIGKKERVENDWTVVSYLKRGRKNQRMKTV